MCIYGPKTVCVLYLDEDRIHLFWLLIYVWESETLEGGVFFFFFLLNKIYRVQDYKLLNFYGYDY